MSSSDDYDDPKLAAQWLGEQRENVRLYLETEGVAHGGIPEEPEWFLAPYVSVWAIESRKVPGAVGWWAISGDLPTDYLSGEDAADLPGVLAGFAQRWREAAELMARGEEPPTVAFGSPEDWPELAPLLRHRADLLQRFAEDEEMWASLPPTPEEVAKRALALAAVVCRSGIETNAGSSQAEAFRSAVLEWLDRGGALSALEPWEREVLESPLGTLAEKQARDAGWRAEALGVLAWALGRWELPPFDVQVDAPAVAETLGFLRPEGLALLQSPSLRPFEELEELVAQYHLIYLRLRHVYEVPSPRSLAQLADDLQVDTASLSLVDGDLVLGGTPLHAAPKERVRIAASAAVERYGAASWLAGDDAPE